ncbi:MAG: bifunctional diaminohydroxyphosphoribosylaminopyrimidine deaminase/5-amino-6-(5-phosphoribosylamino)uracil reductase RibD [candidate division WOR-3 bacterium]|nr:MAG: bifunctional diaminohydroxyphosphoribosylaminopyrimidine deaminase/5-amino-6-(5-phosphoribosylamino)uracil reductase RibD [candidate division WOR-3 bacterium]
MDVSRDNDRYYMQYAMTLASKGWGQTGVNPLVGALVVRDGVIIGRGFHRRIGEAHAEVLAITEAGADTRGADLYVNLEPCCTHGYTPPCVDAITRAGIKRVFIAETDPNPAVEGKSIEILRRRNIEVIFLNPSTQPSGLNLWYKKYIMTKTPFVTMKIAFTNDYRISGFEGKYVTSMTSRRYVHALRSRVGAVLVGINTVLADNPFLTDRLIGRHNPARIILDPDLKIPLNANVLAPDARRIVFAKADADQTKTAELQELGIEVVHLDGNRHPTADLLRKIGMLKIGWTLVEGGGETFNNFLQDKTYDELYVFVAPTTAGKGIEVPLASTIIEKEEPEFIGEDRLYHVYRNN